MNNSKVIFKLNNNIVEMFACSCDKDYELQYNRLFFEMLEKEYSKKALDEPLFYSDYCFHILRDLDYCVQGVLVDQWSAMSIVPEYDKNNLHFSVQYDIFSYGVTITYIFLTLLKENKINLDTDTEIYLNSIKLI